MAITLQYFDGCPNWRDTRSDLDRVLSELGLEAVIETMLINTQESAEENDFRGSPTVLINGYDPFADADAPVVWHVGSTSPSPAWQAHHHCRNCGMHSRHSPPTAIPTVRAAYRNHRVWAHSSRAHWPATG